MRSTFVLAGVVILVLTQGGVTRAADYDDRLDELVAPHAIPSFADLQVTPEQAPDTPTISEEAQALIDENVEDISDDGEDIPHTVEAIESIVDQLHQHE